jgi:hypothetical protein
MSNNRDNKTFSHIQVMLLHWVVFLSLHVELAKIVAFYVYFFFVHSK